MSLFDERDVILDRLSEIEWVDTEPIIAGSAAMVLHGIELGRTPGDIDTFVATSEWLTLQSLKYNSYDLWEPAFEMFVPDRFDDRRRHDPPYLIHQGSIPVHVFFAWRYRPENNWDIARMSRESVEMYGYRVAPLSTVYEQKTQARRPKDLRDMALILEHQQIDDADALRPMGISL